MATPTRHLLKQAFLQLLDETPLHQITVKDITDSCGLNRNSFYYHFEDIPSLLSEIVQEVSNQIIHQNIGANSLEDCLAAAARLALQHKRIVMHIYRSANREWVEQNLFALCQHVIEQFSEAEFGTLPLSEADRQVVLRHYKCLCFGLVIDWLNTGMKYDLVLQYRRFRQLSRRWSAAPAPGSLPAEAIAEG